MIATLTWSAIQSLVIPAGIIALAVGLGFLLQFVMDRRVTESPAIRRRTWLHMILQAVGAGFVFWMAALGVQVAIDLTGLAGPIVHMLDDLVLVLVLLSVTVVAIRFTGAAVLQLSRGPGRQIASGALFASLSQVLVAAMGIIIILESIGIHVTPLLTALGVGGLAVALALQPPLSNLFSGLQLVASHEVRPGDYVMLQSGQAGFVEEINWRSISIREPTNNIIVVPNQLFTQSVFVNYRLPEPQIAARVSLKVAYGSDLDFVERLALEAVQLARQGFDRRETSSDAWVSFEELGDAGVSLAVSFYVPRIVDQERATSAFLRCFYKLLSEHGIGSPSKKPVVPRAAKFAEPRG
jgi:small-conductance mechanosensitive channel